MKPAPSARQLAALLASAVAVGLLAAVLVGKATLSGAGYVSRHVLAARLAWVRNWRAR